jgi:dynein heavy chain
VHRKSLTALITHEVHNRDIVEELTNLGVESIEEFAWKKCLRYYLYKDDSSKTDYNKNPVIVCQVNASLNYCFEYMGVTSRLVITPLTDRCWLTITGALHIKLGASPKGPAGTGKTESTKDLAKGLGIFCLVFNCSEQIEYRVMTRIFSGVVQSGVWTCLDEFNRINVEVMSVIAQQLGDIRQAKLVGKDMCFLNNKEMKINANCGVFITMNPGY